ncbi:hypothetical protein Pla52o_57780 [Novipirellula galeiformis]|uniref:DUF4064 domain-containing protein n=1 Tax=Novipirellula galeiformis TaxID=2528004 RepID=A0A5C6BI01_9BACT|nr:hypothetical protein [Novipirellula galeiformis]TWU10074.1 hypothetical protein Pla52o_57780 [Novipirellula galeiformis]
MTDDANPLTRSSNAPNPYSSTSTAAATVGAGGICLPAGQSRGMVSQVPILGVLMIVQAVLVGLMGLLVAGYAVFMPMIFRQMSEEAAKQGGNPVPMPAQMELGMQIGLAALAVSVFAIAALTLFAGVRMLKYQSRTLSIVTLCIGMLLCLTCYCAPTQIALAIYGLIVLLNGPVVDAFRFAERGHSAREIQQAFLSLP